MSAEEVVEDLVPVAAQLVGCVRDYGPEQTAALLDPLTTGQLYRLAVVLAAMVDPDARPADLLAWTTAGPVLSRPGFDPSRSLVCCPDCGEVLQAHSLARHTRRAHGERQRLLDAGVSVDAAEVLGGREVA